VADLSVFTLLAFSVQLLGDADAETTVVPPYVDPIVCAIFLVEAESLPLTFARQLAG
jgi:hypothetical protein